MTSSKEHTENTTTKVFKQLEKSAFASQDLPIKQHSENSLLKRGRPTVFLLPPPSKQTSKIHFQNNHSTSYNALTQVHMDHLC